MRIILDSDINTKTLDSMAKLVTDQKYSTGTDLFKTDSTAPAALYLIRSGKIEVIAKDGSKEVYERGGYIGHDTLRADSAGAFNNKDGTIVADFTATVVEDCTCGVLTLKDLRKIINTKHLGNKGASKMSKSMRTEDIKLSDLKKHALLGAGTFGQVWLVSRASSSESSRRAYALKIQTKYELCKDGQAKAVVNERNIMARIDHPFIIKLVRTYQDTDFVYMLLEIVQGGELYSYIHSKHQDGVPEGHAKFYAACIAEGLAYMHRLQIVYRDLKPEK
jgi:CRP-like cAMP-binding protein